MTENVTKLRKNGGKIMTKKELVNVVREAKGLKVAEAEDLVNLIIGAIEEKLVAKEEVSLFGFGSFKVVEKPSRECRNPQNGEKITVEAKTVIKFQSAKGLKDKLNG